MCIDPIPPDRLRYRLASLPANEQAIIRDAAGTLAAQIKNVGPDTALLLIWAIGSAMKRQETFND
jgi:hypothetical protein